MIVRGLYFWKKRSVSVNLEKEIHAQKNKYNLQTTAVHLNRGKNDGDFSQLERDFLEGMSGCVRDRSGILLVAP